jgi:replicative DNA helicase Mcm
MQWQINGDKMIEKENYWYKHLKRNNIGQIRSISYILDIDVSKIMDNEIFLRTLEFPKAEIETIQDAARELVTKKEKYEPLIRFININKKALIKDFLPDKDEKRLRSILCLVKRTSSVQSKIIKSCWKCPAGHFTYVRTKHDTVLKPKSCTTDGCRFRDLSHVEERDITINRQFIYVQDPVENMGGDVQPKSIRCEVFGDLCNAVTTGERVVLNGFYRTMPKFKDGNFQAGKDPYFEVNSIERGESAYSDVKWTEEEEKQIVELSSRQDIFDLITDSIAPSVVGMRLCKQAIVLLLFGGVTKIMPDNTRRRGHINMLIVSDPGMAKTILLKYVEQVSPRGVYASGVTSSKVGLVAPIVRDEITGAYTIEPGPYMLAHGGVFCLDEANEISKDDAKYIGECMENGECHITKAVNVIVKTEAPLLAACNPDDGIYDTNLGLAKQVSLPDAILSRFDIKIILTDEIRAGHDRELAHFIGKTLRKGYKNKESTILPGLLRKMIAYSRTIMPELTDDVDTLIQDYYEKIRIESKSRNHMTVTTRQLLSIYHMSEAVARVHHHQSVLVADAQCAIDIFDMAFRNVNTDQQGRLNPGMSDVKGRESLPSLVISAITQISGGDNGTRKASELSVITELKKKGYDADRIEKTIRGLLREGKLSEPVNGLLKVE